MQEPGGDQARDHFHRQVPREARIGLEDQRLDLRHQGLHREDREGRDGHEPPTARPRAQDEPAHDGRVEHGHDKEGRALRDRLPSRGGWGGRKEQPVGDREADEVGQGHGREPHAPFQDLDGGLLLS